ncbi:hypothetical protein C8F01DRAFT_1086991 [Mycena amicta]|nr:hypothetical protein C8F01DRAFT_1086991 [Mycena amicta]
MSASDADEVIDLTGDTSDSDNEEEEASDGDEEQPTIAQLQAAVSTAPEARLRLVLTRLVARNAAVRRALAKDLLTVNAPAPATVARVVPRWETCENCRESYDVNAQDNEECVFHPGDLEVDYEKFVDWDEDCHGPMDSRGNRRDYPENFTWSCCDADGTAPGCVNGRHRAKAHKKRHLDS